MVGSESAKIKSRKLKRMSFHENFTPRNFLAIWYYQSINKLKILVLPFLSTSTFMILTVNKQLVHLPV